MEDLASVDKRAIMRGYDLIMSKVYDFLTLVLLRSFIVRAHQRLLEEAEVGTHSLVLDVGCGTGALLMRMAEGRYSRGLLGVDISKEMLRILKQKKRKAGLHGMIELVQGDAEHLPFRDEVFDILMGAGIFRFLPAPERALKEGFRILKERGRYVLREFAGPADGVREVRHPPILLHSSFTVWRLRSDKIIGNLLRKAGFVDVSIFREGRVPHLPIVMGGFFRSIVFAKGRKPRSLREST